jgi:aminomethyltransferase
VTAGGEAIGRVTSGNYSPTLDRGIALAFLPPEVREGTDVAIDVRGSEVPARVVPLPFYRRPGR